MSGQHASDVNVFTLPLEGMSLIEASAGTGKTTTLVNLYLRAVLIEGFGVEQILAVTYTRAATGELSVRIREKLAEAWKQLQEGTPKGFLADLLQRYDGDEGLPAKRLHAALAAFDEKAVFTIHGFCRRTLADRAFEAGAAFADAQTEDEGELREEVAADFWRRRTDDGASPPYVRWLVDTLGSPAGLLAELNRALAITGNLRIEPEASAEIVKRAEADFEAAALAAKKIWQREGERLRDWFLHGDDLKGNVYVPASTGTLLDEWDEWLRHAPTPSLPLNLERLTRAKAEKSLKKNRPLPDFDFFEQDPVNSIEDASDRLRKAWWQETFAAAFGFIRKEMRRRRRRVREIGYDDMLSNLRDALNSPGGDQLAARIARDYPLILVDEFQDTDPLQHEIFTRIHEAGEKHGLILIGDPKQAIYRFRGADVFTYMRVSGECAKTGRLYKLTHNYRSTPELLKALNALFESTGNPFEYTAISYLPVRPGKNIAPLVAEQDAALTVLWHSASEGDQGGKINKDKAAAISADVCAAEIARLLALGAQGRAKYDDNAVQAKDIAVLVNKNEQGVRVQRALRRRGIAAAMVSPENVFASLEAEELQIVLAAVAEPANGGLLRRALATRLLGATAAEIPALTADEARWSRLVSEFRDYYQRWQTQGFAAMFARLTTGRAVIGRTLARADGDRAMTNLRHLAELTSEQEARHPGIAPLLVWFALERTGTAESENRQLRLESDENLVRITTVHRAKGLQYPIVFLPFLWDAKRPEHKSMNPAILVHEKNFDALLDLGSARITARQEDADKEARAEDARRTYVALTRAERACYVIAMPARQLESSAFARLLNVEETGELEEKLYAWEGAAGGAARIRDPVADTGRTDIVPERPQGEARAFTHKDRLRQRFHVASYSLLAAGASGGAAELPDRDETAQAAPVAETATGIHAFPAGAASGRFLHALIEALDFNADTEKRNEAVQKQLVIHGIEPKWADGLSSWLAAVFATPLGAPGCTLRDITGIRRIDELEFYFPLKRIHAQSLDTAIEKFAPQASRPPLHFDEIEGLMKGYLDLVFEHGGRYWIADYKSNRLGSDLAAYTPDALDRAMTEHRYDLQYLIYTVALHRYLKSRIRDYDYERHFGGVLYLFLRGMAPEAPEPRGVWHTRPAKRDVECLDAFLAGSAHD